MKSKPCVAASLALSGYCLAVLADTDYRLTGIVHVGDSDRVVLVEFKEGPHKTLRAGDRLEGDLIREISKEGILLETGGGPKWITLNGNSASFGIPSPDPAKTQGPGREVDRKMLMSALDKASQADQKEKENKRLADVVGKLLDLPADARIKDVDGIPVLEESLDNAVDILRRALRHSEVVIRLSVANVPGTDAIYIPLGNAMDESHAVE